MAAAAPAVPAAADTKIRIVYYSMYGHMKVLVDAVKRGIESAGATPEVLRVPETLPKEVTDAMGVPSPVHDADVPLVDRATFAEADGFIFGVPTRYGNVSAQMKNFMDSTGALWSKGALVGKPAGAIVSTGTLAGGQETTIASSVVPFATHHGMLFVPLGYTHPILFGSDSVHGGGPWGPGTIVGPTGGRMPSEEEITVAEHYGKHFAKIAIALKRGRSLE